jgi:hypothetical protein
LQRSERVQVDDAREKLNRKGEVGKAGGAARGGGKMAAAEKIFVASERPMGFGRNKLRMRCPRRAARANL